MKKKDKKSIAATENLSKLVEKMAEKLYEDWSESSVSSLEEGRKWVMGTVKKILWATELESAVIKYRKVKFAERMSGPLGDLSYVVSKNTEDYARRKPSKPPKKTIKRVAQQSFMKQAISAEKELTLTEMNLWNKIGESINKSGVYLFRGIYISLLKDGKPIANPLLPTPELLDYYNLRKRKSSHLI